MNKWRVLTKKRIEKNLKKLPRKIQEAYEALVFDLSLKGACPGKKWRNYSPLGANKHHCHLTYSYVACWEQVSGEIRLLEVYYVGSREDAPY